MRWKLGLKVLQSISVDIVLTIRSNLDVFLLWEDVVTVMTLPLHFLICVNLLQQLSVLAATHIQLRTYPWLINYKNETYFAWAAWNLH